MNDYRACATLNLVRRIWEHKSKVIRGFTYKYTLDKLVYYKQHQDVTIAIKREKRLKEWQRKWKLRLIENFNPYWCDLSKGT